MSLTPGPPDGQPISSGHSPPMTDEERRDPTRRLLRLFPSARAEDFWAKQVQPPDGNGEAPDPADST